MNAPMDDDAAGASLASVLTSWKEIARFFGKSVRTVQRWERQFALPVRRPKGALAGIVLADPGELAAWLQQQTSAGGAFDAEPKEPCARCAELESQVEFLRARCATLDAAAALPAVPLAPARPKRRLQA